MGGGPLLPRRGVSLASGSPDMDWEARCRELEAEVARLKGQQGPQQVPGAPRRATRQRKTKETDISVELVVDGSGRCEADTGVGFLDHMLDQLAKHGLMDVTVQCKGDLWIDDHHTVEDVGIALGQCLGDALGDKAGIRRFGSFTAPLDEALVSVTLDLSGRAHLGMHGWHLPSERIGDLSTQMVKHFFLSLASTSGTTLHITQHAGENSHHIVEATFKAFAKALRAACEADPRNAGVVPSSKGNLIG